MTTDRTPHQIVISDLRGLSITGIEDPIPVSGVLVRTFDGVTWEVCYKVRDRWSVGTPVDVRTESL